jgi:cytochrome P450
VDRSVSGGTAGIAPGSGFDSDPLGWLDAAAAEGRGVRWISPEQLCVFDADWARSLLKNEDGLLVQHSDFFGPVEDALAPRAAQVAVARECLTLVQRHARGLDRRAHVDSLGERSLWPGAGNRMMLAMMRPVLASADRSPAIHSALDFILEDRIANRHGPKRRRWFRILRRVRLARAILREAEDSRRSGDPADLLDIVANAQSGMKDGGLVHLYLALVFALAGSIGFALGWALLLAVRHDRTGSPPQDIVREALRLYPVAWLLGRTPVADADILGERVSPRDEIVISPYAVHRNPAYWPEPAAFRPERWQGKVDRRAWLPFGAGGQSCVAASLTIDIASEALAEIFRRPVSVEGGDGPPSVRAALAAPTFTLVRQL